MDSVTYLGIFMKKTLTCTLTYIHMTDAPQTTSGCSPDHDLTVGFSTTTGLKKRKKKNGQMQMQYSRFMFTQHSTWTVFLPPWWCWWSWSDDTPSSRPHSSLHTWPEAHRRGWKCAPPQWGTPAPPPPTSQWSCRSCVSRPLGTSIL